MHRKLHYHEIIQLILLIIRQNVCAFQNFSLLLQCLMLKMRPSDASKGWDDMHTKGVCVARFRHFWQCKGFTVWSEQRASAPRLSWNYILLMLIINILKSDRLMR